MGEQERVDTLVREKRTAGIEIVSGTFVVDKKKFLVSQFLGMKSKSKIVRNASRYLLQAYSLKTGEEIPIPAEIKEDNSFKDRR